MKRLFCILAIAFISIYASAEPIGKKTAFEIAHNFFSGNPTTITGSVKLVEVKYEQCLQTKSGDISDIPFFIFNNENGGFVIVSNHTSAAPILAYSFENKFEADNMPEGVRAWLEGQSELILRQKDNDPETGIRQKWNDLIYPTKATQTVPKHVKLETAQWGQGFPYNNYCPTIDGEKTFTGCLPTAIAIVMRFWEWPKEGNGYIPEYYYDPNTGNGYGQHKPDDIDTIKGGGYYLGHEYLWKNMPLYSSLEKGYTDEQQHAIATLMKDCGAIVEVAYGVNGSAAALETSKYLYKYMNYDAGMRLDLADYHTWEEWISVLESEISAGRPVLMSGRDNNNIGHAFVADGFDENHYISFNWGWDGTFNGFFSTTHPKLDNSRHPNYFWGQNAWLGLQADKGNTPQFTLSWSDGASYLSILEKEYDLSKPFTLCNIHLSTENPMYYKNGDYIGDVRACTFDAGGNLKEFISSSEPIFLKKVCSSIKCTITKPIETGDYIALVFKCVNGNKWIPINDIQTQKNAIIYLKETEQLDENTSIQIFPKIEKRHIGTAYTVDSSLLVLTTMTNTSFQLLDSNGNCCEPVTYIDGVPDWNYTYNDDSLYQKEVYINIYLSSLSPQ
ncbi:MAG: C10 family peptidase [Bacteroidales bacterium]|nr:C10 family peptidase [Bacteroidales bacterium]